ncbi:hypothetical protein O181_052891 [Austropuccinia psidii MF-1]|uniref:Uncharacterized protein n=1 Tax=Austropuccinia psidii MF-1 TaxID=1389203 RepID=A0A9Q3HPP0_9BASI|nr:hypothetical protein [Austropuccinia psidii MF-1]
MLTTLIFNPKGNPSTQSSVSPSLNQSRHQPSQIGIKRILLQSSLNKRNGKSLKFCIPRSTEEDYGIWWNGKALVKTHKDLLGNQPKNSRVALNLLRTSTLYILTSQDPIVQELYHLWCLVRRGITKSKSHYW